jgi:hypothetical protein
VNGITIVTPTIPERAALFAELTVAMECQVEDPDAWIVFEDVEHIGTIAALEILMAQVETEWFVPLADDDLIDPTFVQLLAAAVHDDVDVVWPLCRVEGTYPWWDGISVFDADLLREDNYIPGTAAIRTSLFREVGGYRTPPDQPHEDWDLWRRMLDKGARFECVPVRCWTYRFGPWPRRSYGGFG